MANAPRTSPIHPGQSSAGSRATSPVVISRSQSTETLIHNARRLQAQANRATEDADDLRRKLVDKNNEGDAPRKRRRVANSGGDGDDDTDDDEERQAASSLDPQDIQLYGRKYVITKGLWLRANKKTFNVPLDENYNPLADHRFQNTESIIQGELRDILDILPAKYHGEVLKTKFLQHHFMEGMSSQRSNTHTRIRNVAALAIFGKDSVDYLKTSESRREHFREAIGWKEGDTEGSGRYSALDAPIIHKDYTGGGFNLDTVFLNPILLRVFVAIIRGPGAARAFSDGVTSTTQGEIMADKLSLTHTTPGAIAATCILTRWAMSADIKLQAKGTESAINWQEDFNEYLEILVSGLDKRRKSIKAVFRTWDEAIFTATADMGLGGGQQQARDAEGLRRAKDQLNAAAEESSEEGAE